MQMNLKNMSLSKGSNKEVAAIIGSIVKSLECAICLRIPCDPISIGCGHFYCRECITTVLKRNFRAACPLCMKSYTKRSIQEASQRKSICSAFSSAVKTLETLLGVEVTSPSVKLALFSTNEETALSDETGLGLETQIADDLAKDASALKKDSLKVNSEPGATTQIERNIVFEDNSDVVYENAKEFGTQITPKRTEVQKPSSKKMVMCSKRKNRGNSLNDQNDEIDNEFEASLPQARTRSMPSKKSDKPSVGSMLVETRSNSEMSVGNTDKHHKESISHPSNVIQIEETKIVSSKLSKSKNKRLFIQPGDNIQMSRNVSDKKPHTSKFDNLDEIVSNQPAVTHDSEKLNDEHQKSNNSNTDSNQTTTVCKRQERKSYLKATECSDDTGDGLANKQGPVSHIEMTEAMDDDELACLEELNIHNRETNNATLLCRSPGWSRIRQMNKDFHLKRFPLLHVQKNLPLQSHPKGKTPEEPIDMSHKMEVCSSVGDKTVKGNSELTESKTDVMDSPEKLDAVQKPTVENCDEDKSMSICDAEPLGKRCKNSLPSYAEAATEDILNDCVIPKDNDALENSKKVETKSCFANRNSSESTLENTSCRSIEKRISDVTREISLKLKSKTMDPSHYSSFEDTFCQGDHLLSSQSKDECSVSRSKFKTPQVTPKGQFINSKSRSMLSTKSPASLKQQKVSRRSKVSHTGEAPKRKSYESNKIPDISAETKVVKRVCFTLDEILFHFDRFNTSGETQIISSVPLPFSEFLLQFAVSDQTLNVSILKNLKRKFSGSSESFSSCEKEPQNYDYNNSKPYETLLHTSKEKGSRRRKKRFLNEENKDQKSTSLTESISNVAECEDSITVPAIKLLDKNETSNQNENQLNETLHNGCSPNVKGNTKSSPFEKKANLTNQILPTSPITQEDETHDCDDIYKGNNTKNEISPTSATKQPSPVPWNAQRNEENNVSDTDIEMNECFKNVSHETSNKVDCKKSETTPQCSPCVSPELNFRNSEKLSSNYNVRKTPDSLGEELFSEDIDPFADSSELVKCVGVPCAEFDELLEESDGYASDPDMLFANNLVAPLRDIAKKLPANEKRSPISISSSSVNKSFMQKNKKFKRITTMTSSDESDSCDIPTQPLVTKRKLSAEKMKSPRQSSKNTSMLNVVETEECIPLTEDANTGVVDRMRQEIEQMNAKINELEKEITEDDIGASDDSDSEMVKPTNSQRERGNSKNNNNEELHSDDSMISSDLFTEPIPPTPPTLY